jgi:uncharacterized protein YjbI with pentapeptide repeats
LYIYIIVFFGHYHIMTDDINTAPTSPGCLLLIDSRVTDYQDIINAKQTGVQHLVFHVEDMNTEANPFEYIQTRITELGVSAYTNVGLIQHNMRLPVYSMFGSGSGSGSGSFDATIADVETADPTLQTWAGVSGFITHLKNTYGVQNFDMMACALYSDPNWKYIIDTLAAQTGVTIRASTDDTGAAALGGDWFLESHTGVNLKDVYFTEAIEDFRGVLIFSTKLDTHSLFSTKSMAVGKATAWGATNYGGGTDVNTITGGVITSGVVAVYGNNETFAALKTNGSVSTWGPPSSGGNQTLNGTSPSVASSLTSGVVEIYANRNAFAALKNDGTVITWGFSDYGGSSTSVVLTNVVDIFSSIYSFAALKSNGSLVTWGQYLGDSSTVAAALNSDVVSVIMAIRGDVGAAAAIKSNGSVVTWPSTSTIGGNSSTVTSSISSGVVVVYSDNHTFAALKNNGSVINWGNTTYSLDGNPYTAATSVTLTNIVTINRHDYGAYAALNINGGVVTWGLNMNGGNSSGKSLSSNVVKVYNNYFAFAALKFDGSVVTWGSSAYGGDSTSVASDLSSGVVAVYGTVNAFAALKSNGRVITWGSSASGGSSSSVATDISAGIVGIYSNYNAFAALRNDGKLITWGNSLYGGNSSSVASDLSAGVVSVNNTSQGAFAAITSSATTFDLSMSYYRDIDRYNILRNKENRRRVNLTTLNNNVFTLSSARDIQKFNYTIPSGNSFRIIIPDYVSSNYSIISTASIPSPAAANYIIACEEGEPVTISGVTYINYGTFVYRRNVADNTFTKMTSAVIGGVTYKLYGGDGIFSSGIALQYRFGAFSIPAKTFGDTPFNLSAPVSDSPGAFTYTSSDTTVATVTTSGTVTIIKVGTTTITATQAASGSFTSDSITALLVVSKVDSTLGALTVPAKVTNDIPFTINTPTSTNSSIVSPVYTITSATSMIVPPPSIHINPLTYEAGWFQEGGNFIGDAAGDQGGYSVSMSANGTIVALGYVYASSGGISTRGLVRVFKSDITKTIANGYGPIGWTQLGGDIYGEAATDYSGFHVRLSADGTVVAISATGNDGTSGTVDTGDSRGHVRVYKYTPSKTNAISTQTDPSFGPVGWTRMGADIDGQATNDNLGQGLSISADGNIIAVSASLNRGPSGTALSTGQVRIFRYTPNKAAVTNVNDASFGPAGWTRIGSDIYGDAAGEQEGFSIALSADGTSFVTGAPYPSVNRGRIRTYVWNGTQWNKRGSDIMGIDSSDQFGHNVAISADGNIIAGSAPFDDGSGNALVNSGSVRVYYWNTSINDWTQQGGDIYGEAAGDGNGGLSISLSSDGTIIAIGASSNDGTSGTVDTGDNRGHVRIYKYDVTKTQAQLIQTQANFGPVGWNRISNVSGYMIDLDGGAASNSFGRSVSLSSDGTKVVIGEIGYDESSISNKGRARVYYINTTNALTYSSSNSSVADVCGNLLLIKGVNGTSTITASQTGNTVTGRLDVSGTTYTLQYNPIAFTSSNTSVATISTYGTVTLAGIVGTSTITATQPETLNYGSRSVTGTLVVSKIDSTLGALTVPEKIVSDPPFTLTAPTSTVSSIISPVNTIPSTFSVIPTPPDIRDIIYGTTWGQLGPDILGTQNVEQSGWSVSISADGTTVAIGSAFYDTAGTTGNTLTNEGRVRVFKYNGTSWGHLGTIIFAQGTQANEAAGYSVALSSDGMTVAVGSVYYDTTSANVGRTRVYKYNTGTSTWSQLGLDISGNQVDENSGCSVSISADGTTVAIGSCLYDSPLNNVGRVRIYKYNTGTSSWGQLGLDISGSLSSEYFGFSVSLSADGTTVAVGSYGYDSSLTDVGRTRIYKYNTGTSSWGQLGLDISGTQTGEQSGYSVALSSDGTTVAVGSNLYDKAGGTTNANTDEGRIRVYKYNTGTSSWGQLGLDISGTQSSERSGYSVSISADGSTVAIGSLYYTTSLLHIGRTRVYKYNTGTSSWGQLGLDISGTQASEQSGYSVALSADGTTIAIGSAFYDVGGDEGRVRVYRLNAATNAITYSSSNSSIAELYSNLLLIKGVNGTSTITASQTGNTVTGRLDVSGTTYTLQYNPFTYSISDTNIATISTYGTVTLTGGAIGTSTITATQPETLNYASRSVTGTLDVSGIVTVLGPLTIPAKMLGDASFNLTAPTTNNTGGAFTYTSSNTAVATVTSGGEVTITGIGTTTITATQSLSGLYTSASVSGSLVVNFGNTNTITQLLTDGATVIPTPVSNISTTYGSLWNKLGADIVGKVNGDESGTSISVSADGTIVAIGARSNSTNRGTVRVYKYNDVTWNQIGADINGEASSDYSGQSVSLSANGRVVAIGANMNDGSGNLLADSGHVRIYEFNGTNWVQRGGDIDGEANGDQSGISVSLSEDGNIVAIGAIMNDGSGNALSNSGHVRVYKYNATKTSPQLTDQSLATFGPAGWDRLGGDIDGEAVNDQSGFSVSISANGTIVAIGAIFNDGTSGTADTGNNRGHVRVYRYNATKTTPQLTNQSLTTFGPAGWDRMGSDIDGEAAADQSGFSVSLSADGTAVAIGSPLYDASGVSNSGRVRVFAWNGTSWAQRGGNINGVNINENVGDSVSLSANGNILSVSSFMKVVNYSYNSTTNTWSQIGANIIGDTVSSANIVNALTYSPLIYLDSTNTSSYNGTTWTNLGSLGGSVNMTTMGTYDALDNNGSFNFNGSSNYGRIITPSSASFTNVTFVAVVKLATPATSAWRVILSLSWWNPTLTIYNNNLNFYSTSPSITNATSTNFTFAANTWYFVASTYNTSTGVVTFYVNGVATGTFNAATGGSWSGTNFTIGADSNNNNYFWNGKMSYIALYNRVLTASEIANLSNNYQTYKVSLSSQGNILAVGAREYDGVTRTNTNIGVGRVYRIDTSGNYTFSSNNTTIADVCGNIILPKNVGSTTVGFTQSASGETASRSGTITLNITGITPTIGSLSLPPTKNLGDASFNITAPMSDSSGAFTYTSSNTAVATVTSDGIVTIVGVGTTTITATQAASGNYNQGSVSSSLAVSASLSNFSISPKFYGDTSFDLTNPDSSDNTVGFTFASSNTSVATLSGTGGRTVTIVGVGSTVITASQAATANRGQLDISATLVVHPATPVITLAPITKSYGNPSFRLSPSSTNTDTIGGNVFTFSSDNIAVVSFLDASLVRINGIGTATIAITQAASANFTDASSSVVITVNKGASGFSASTFTVPSNKTFGDESFGITTAPISSSTGAITYESSDVNVATITSNGSAITLVGQGTVTFTASQEASALYTADTKTSNTLTVARKTVALLRDIPSADTITKSYGDANFYVVVTNESNGAFSFTSSDLSSATIDISTGEVNIVGLGSTTLTATRSQTAQYNESSVTWTLNIGRGTPTLTGITSMSRNVTVAPFTVTATSASNGTVSYALQDPSSTVLTIHPTTGRVRLKSPGSAVIVASQAQGTLYNAPSDLTATITVIEAGISLQETTVTDSYDLDDLNLNGASLANSTITNTNFSSSNLGNSNFNNSNVTNANMSNTDLSGSTMRNATMNGVNFTSARLQRTDLSGSNIRNSTLNSADLSGSILARLDASGASFINANLSGTNLSNANFTNANMTNADITGADITNVTFSIPQKLQLLKNQNNRVRSEIQVSQTTGNNILAVVSNHSAVRDVVNIANATFKVVSPTTTTLESGINIIDIILDTDNYAYFYYTIKDDEYFRIQGIIYRIDTTVTPPIVKNYYTNAVVENTTYGIKAIRLLAGSLTIIVNSQNTLSTSSFVVPSIKQDTDAPFSPTTLPTSNSSAPIVYSSSNTNVATINSSTGVITPVAGSSGFVRFTASQVATQTHESASITSNELFVNKLIDFTLAGLNQTFSLSTLAALDASSISIESTDATAVFYVRLSDMMNLFQYQTDSFDVNDVDASDIKYYVFHRSTPTELHLNPSHAMMNKTESAGMIGSGDGYDSSKSLVKHDFIRYIALRLFNTHHGVDLFKNEEELHENIAYLGETVRYNIDNILTGVSTTSASETMAYDASGNKYLTNDTSGNTNLCRELMRQIAASDAARFYNNGGNTTGIRNMPLQENDSINFKLTITAAAGQNILTGVSEIPSRTYMIKMVLKNTVNTSSNDTNTVVTDSEMYPNSYPYSTSVVTYAPTVDSSNVYNVYSPPAAAIPTARFGYNGWYYTNSTAWVNVAPQVRDRVKWIVPSNSVGSSTISNLQYIRMNLKVFNKTSLPFLVVYTQAGSYRKYTISAPNSLVNGTVYSFFMNFNSYSREPATIGATNAALTYSGVSSGSFADSEIISSIAIESDNTAAAGSVEFTLSRIVVGESGGEKEYGFSGSN